MNIKISQPLCYTAKGKKPNQEDSLFPPMCKATQDTRVFLVCDGMGGHEHGEVASACVAETIGNIAASQPLCSTEEMRTVFERALEQAYRNLDALDNSDSEKKMGTTLTFLALCTDGVLVAHIGDSRVYQLRPGKGIVFQTRDHSLVNDLVASGEISEEEAMTHPQRNVITRAIQPHQEYLAKATYNVLYDIREGDMFFMCCDGVIEQLDNKDLCTYLLDSKSLDKRLERVRKECEKRGTRDNNTAYVIEVSSGTDNDSVEVTKVQEQDTKQPNQNKNKHNTLCITITLLVIAVIAIFAFIFLSASADSKHEKNHSDQKTEQVQGTISRHRK